MIPRPLARRLAALILAAGPLITTASLAACTSVPLAGTADLRALRLAATPEPQRYDVNVFASPATGLRLGAYDAVLARDIARPPESGDKDALFTQALVERANFQLGAELDAALTAALKAAGIKLQDGNQPAQQSGAATLVIELLYAGYVGQPLRPYTPLLLLEARLVAPGGDLLFRQRYAYSRLPYQHDDVRFEPEPRFTFQNEAALMRDVELAAEGLRLAIPRIAMDLKTRLISTPQ